MSDNIPNNTHADPAPTSMQEYIERFHKHSKVTGYGLDCWLILGIKGEKHDRP